MFSSRSENAKGERFSTCSAFLLIPIIALTLLIACACAHAQTRPLQRFNLVVVTADETSTTKSIVQEFIARLPSAQVVSIDNKGILKTDKNTILIPIGPSALRSLLLQNVEGAIFSAFSSSQALKTLVKEWVPATASSSISGVYADPSPASQMQLIHLLYNKPIRIGVVLSEKSSYMEPLLQKIAAQTGHDISLEYLTGEDSLNRLLNRLKDAAALLAIPDSAVYNPDNIRNILVTTYRRNQAIIGFSSAVVNAGALASTISTIPDITAQIIEQINQYATTGKAPEIQYPKYFSVVVNDGVARSLNVIVDDQVRNYSNKPVVSSR